jgi:hypothetical protein
MKHTIKFSVDFFGEPIHMEFEKEYLKQQYEYFISDKKMREQEYNISIREYIKIKIAWGIAVLIQSKYK